MVIRISCQLGPASPIQECVPVEVIGSRLRLRIHHGGNRLPELRVIALHQDFGLSNGIQRRIDDDLAQNRILIRGTVEQIPNTGEKLPLNVYGRAALRVLGVVLRPSHRLGTRNQQLKAGKVAIRYRQAGNGSAVKNGSDFRFIGLKLWRLGGYSYRFAGVADGELQIDFR